MAVLTRTAAIELAATSSIKRRQVLTQILMIGDDMSGPRVKNVYSAMKYLRGSETFNLVLLMSLEDLLYGLGPYSVVMNQRT